MTGSMKWRGSGKVLVMCLRLGQRTCHQWNQKRKPGIIPSKEVIEYSMLQILESECVM